MGFEEDMAAPRRRRRTVETADENGADTPPVADVELELDVAPEPVIVEDEPAPKVPAPMEVAPTPAAPESNGRDIGNWRYTPWGGRDMWTHKDTVRTSFKEEFVRKHRHQ